MISWWFALYSIVVVVHVIIWFPRSIWKKFCLLLLYIHLHRHFTILINHIVSRFYRVLYVFIVSKIVTSCFRSLQFGIVLKVRTPHPNSGMHWNSRVRLYLLQYSHSNIWLYSSWLLFFFGLPFLAYEPCLISMHQDY